MLTALRIGNFKAFAESQRIPVRPLPLIYGANSSGKSSVLHSMILARHAQETGELDVHRTNVGGESVDLDGFRQYVHLPIDEEPQLSIIDHQSEIPHD